MRYMLLIYTTEEAALSASREEQQAIASGHRTVMDETARRGVFRGAEPLQPTRAATTVRVQNGNVLVSDGPFAETKEQLAGYYILECQNLDEAISWAAKIPTTCGGTEGCVEIRPIRDLTAQMESALA